MPSICQLKKKTWSLKNFQMNKYMLNHNFPQSIEDTDVEAMF